MEYKDIVVHLGKDRRSRARLDAAVQLAQEHESRVTGVYVLSPCKTPGFVHAEFRPEVLKRLDTEERARVEAAEGEFHDLTAGTGVPGEWRLTSGNFADAIVTSAGCTDVTIVGQTDPDDDESHAGLAEDVMMGGGGPVLIWPYAGAFASNPETIMLAWNGTREAKHALDAALPLMQHARKVVVFGVDRCDGKHIPGADVSAHLARHGVRAEARHTVTAPGIGVADALLSEIGDRGIDLLVMGGYGHSRLRERLLGGVTRDVLREMTVPVLMAH